MIEETLAFQLLNKQDIITKEDCTYTKEDNSEQDYYYCPCATDKNQIICRACKDSCHKHHLGTIQITGNFNCSCGQKKHIISDEDEQNFIKYKQNEKNRVCFYRQFHILNDKGFYQVEDGKIYCAICTVQDCSKNDDPDEEKLNHYEVYELGPEENEKSMCQCNKHYEPSFISLYYELQRKIDLKEYLLNFNINIIFQSEECIKQVLIPLLQRIQNFEDEKDNGYERKFYTDFILLNLLQFIEHFFIYYSNRNDYTNNFFDGEFINKNLNKNSVIIKSLKTFRPHNLLSLLEREVKKEDLTVHNYSSYFRIKFYFLDLLFDIFIKSFISDNNNTIETHQFLNLSFFQRYLYISDSKNFYRYNRDPNKFIFSKNFETFERFTSFLEQFVNVKLKTMESFLRYIDYSKNAANILINDTFSMSVFIFCHNFTFLIKYNLIDEKATKKYFDLIFEVMLLYLEQYNLFEKEIESINLQIEDEQSPSNKNSNKDKYQKRLNKFKENQVYIFTLIKSIYLYLINRNDHNFFLSMTRSNLDKFESLVHGEELKFSFEDNYMSNLVSRVFSMTLYHFLMITYKSEEKNKDFISQIPTFDYYAKKIFQLLIGDNESYINSIDRINRDYNNLIYDFLLSIDKKKINLKACNFVDEYNLHIQANNLQDKVIKNKELEVLMSTRQTYRLDKKENELLIEFQKKWTSRVVKENFKFYLFEINEMDYYILQMEEIVQSMHDYLNLSVGLENVDKKARKDFQLMINFTTFFQNLNEFFQIVGSGLIFDKKGTFKIFSKKKELLDILYYIVEDDLNLSIMMMTLNPADLYLFFRKPDKVLYKLNAEQEKGHIKEIEFFYKLQIKLMKNFIKDKLDTNFCPIDNFAYFVDSIKFLLKFLRKKYNINPDKFSIIGFSSDVRTSKLQLDDEFFFTLSFIFQLFRYMITLGGIYNNEIFDGFEILQLFLFDLKSSFKKQDEFLSNMDKFFTLTKDFIFNTGDEEFDINSKYFMDFIYYYLKMMNMALSSDYYINGLIDEKYLLINCNEKNYFQYLTKLNLSEKIDEHQHAKDDDVINLENPLLEKFELKFIKELNIFYYYFYRKKYKFNNNDDMFRVFYDYKQDGRKDSFNILKRSSLGGEISYGQLLDSNADEENLFYETYSLQNFLANLRTAMHIFSYKKLHLGLNANNLDLEEYFNKIKDMDEFIREIKIIFKFYQDVIVSQMYNLVNYKIVQKTKLKGDDFYKLYESILTFLNVSISFYEDTNKLFRSQKIKNHFKNDYFDFFIKLVLREEELQFFRNKFDSILFEVDGTTKKEKHKVGYFEIDKFFKIFRSTFALIYNKRIDNQVVLEIYKNRYKSFETTYYGINDKDIRQFHDLRTNLHNLAIQVKTLHLEEDNKLYIDEVNRFRNCVSSCYNKKLSLIKCFEYNDLSSKEFLPENCFFYLLNKAFDNLTPSVLTEKNTWDDIPNNNLKNGFLNISHSNLKVYNAYSIVLLRNLIFYEVNTFQKIFLIYLENSKNFLKIANILTEHYVFSFFMAENLRMYDIEANRVINNLFNYEICASVINIFQSLCENHSVSTQNQFYSLEISPEENEGEKEKEANFFRYSFVNFLFKLLLKSIRSLNFDDGEQLDFKITFFKSMTQIERLFNRTSNLVIEMIQGCQKQNLEYFFSDIRSLEDIKKIQESHLAMLKPNQNEEDKRNANFVKSIFNLFENKKVRYETKEKLELKDEIAEKDDYFLMDDRVENPKKRDSKYLNLVRNMGKKINLLGGARSGSFTHHSYIWENFKFIEFMCFFKHILKKSNNLDTHNNVLVYNTLLILNNILEQDSLNAEFVNKFSEILGLDFMMNLSSSFLKKVIVRYLDRISYENFQMFALRFKETDLSKRNYIQLYRKFVRDGRVYNDIYFKISQLFYLIILILGNKYEYREAVTLLDIKSQDEQFESYQEPSSKESNNENKPKIQFRDKKTQFRSPSNTNIDRETEYTNEILTLAKKELEVDLKLKKVQENLHITEAIFTNNFYQKAFKKVEFVVDGSIKRLYYIKNPDTNFFKRYHARQFFLFYSNHSDSSAKILSLMSYIEEFLIEVQYMKKTILPNRLFSVLYKLDYYYVDLISFILTLIIQALLMFTLTIENVKSAEVDWVYQTVRALGVIQIVINFVALSNFILTKYSLAVLTNEKNNEQTEFYFKFTKLFHIYVFSSWLTWKDVVYINMNLIIAVIALSQYWMSFMFTFQFCTIIRFFITIQRIVEAFKIRFNQLISMVFFMLVFIYFYTNLGFYFLNQEFYDRPTTTEGVPTEDVCKTLVECFITHFDTGSRMGGGIAEILDEKPWKPLTIYFARWFYDMVYFIAVILLLLNMVNGIIVSTFSGLREKDDEKDQDYKNKCFLCSIDIKEFEKRKIKFKNHILDTHNIIHYVNYIVFLKLSNEFDLNYNQSKIREGFNKRKVDIFPIHKTKDLPDYEYQSDEEDEDDM